MRVFFASDLHVDVAGNEPFVRELAAIAAADRPDVVIIAGDVCNGTARLGPTLRLFADAAQHRVYVPGNHELWALSAGEPAARERYYQEIPRIARAAGFHPLVTEPLVVADVGFAGTMGWYDYSFTDPADGYTPAELAAKTRDGLQWMDGRYVRWTGPDGRALADAEVAALMLDDLRDQLDALAGEPLRTILLVTHHLAFKSLVPPVFVDGHLKFFRAFLGSEGFGEAARKDARVSLALAGHVHSVRSVQEGGIAARTCPTGYPRERKPGVVPADRRLLLEI